MVALERSFVKDMFNLSGKVALVTGGSGALGSTIAKGYGYQGVKVMIAGRHEDKLKVLAEEFAAEGIAVAYSVGDPAVEADAERIVAETVAKFGSLDILLTAHGYSKPGSILEQPTDAWQAMMDANVRGAYLMSKYAAKQMVTAKTKGRIILVSSARSKRGMKGYTGYSTSKAAVDLLAQSLACDLGEYGILVNTFNPTVFRSDLTEWMFHNDNVYQNFLKRLPIGRLGEPSDFVGIASFLASDAAAFLTAGNYAADGGYWGN